MSLLEKCYIYAATLANLSKVEKDNWYNKFEERFVHYSTAIEGNTCSQSEVTIILRNGILPADKPLAEVQEVKYHQKAWEFALAQYKSTILDEALIKEIHRKVLYYDETMRPGEYRTVNIIIRDAEHHPPKAHHLDRFLQAYYQRLQSSWSHPIAKASFAHAELTKIHPFTDGNGRTSRLVMNYVLLQAGIPPVAITNTGKAEYFDTLAIYDETNDIQPLQSLIEKFIEKELNLFFNLYSEKIPMEALPNNSLQTIAAGLMVKFRD